MSRPTRLPRGRHGIPREEVLASQRGRILVAMTDAVAEQGFARTVVADVIRRAGVSRETFYQQFSGKDECFLAAIDGAAALLGDGLATAFADGLEAALAAYLQTLADEPAAARTFLVEVYSAGPEAIRRRAAMLDGFVELTTRMVGAEDEDARFRCEAFVGAVSALVTARVAAGQQATLPALHAPLVGLAHRLLDDVPS